MEHIFHKIILNIYFDHILIICLYRVFSVHCTSYTLVQPITVTKYTIPRETIRSPFFEGMFKTEEDLCEGGRGEGS